MIYEHEGDAMKSQFERTAEAIVEAEDAFWAVIVEKFPEVKTGDFPPDATAIRLQNNVHDVSLWLRLNKTRSTRQT